MARPIYHANEALIHDIKHTSATGKTYNRSFDAGGYACVSSICHDTQPASNRQEQINTQESNNKQAAIELCKYINMLACALATKVETNIIAGRYKIIILNKIASLHNMIAQANKLLTEDNHCRGLMLEARLQVIVTNATAQLTNIIEITNLAPTKKTTRSLSIAEGHRQQLNSRPDSRPLSDLTIDKTSSQNTFTAADTAASVKAHLESTRFSTLIAPSIMTRLTSTALTNRTQQTYRCQPQIQKATWLKFTKAIYGSTSLWHNWFDDKNATLKAVYQRAQKSGDTISIQTVQQELALIAKTCTTKRSKSLKRTKSETELFKQLQQNNELRSLLQITSQQNLSKDLSQLSTNMPTHILPKVNFVLRTPKPALNHPISTEDNSTALPPQHKGFITEVSAFDVLPQKLQRQPIIFKKCFWLCSRPITPTINPELSRYLGKDTYLNFWLESLCADEAQSDDYAENITRKFRTILQKSRISRFSGTSLYNIQNLISIEKKLSIIMQCTETLAHLEEHNLMYSDITANNILVNGDRSRFCDLDSICTDHVNHNTQTSAYAHRENIQEAHRIGMAALILQMIDPDANFRLRRRHSLGVICHKQEFYDKTVDFTDNLIDTLKQIANSTSNNPKYCTRNTICITTATTYHTEPGNNSVVERNAKQLQNQEKHKLAELALSLLDSRNAADMQQLVSGAINHTAQQEHENINKTLTTAARYAKIADITDNQLSFLRDLWQHLTYIRPDCHYNENFARLVEAAHALKAKGVAICRAKFLPPTPQLISIANQGIFSNHGRQLALSTMSIPSSNSSDRDTDSSSNDSASGSSAHSDCNSTLGYDGNTFQTIGF